MVLNVTARRHTEHKAGQGRERCDLEENHLDFFGFETVATQNIPRFEVSLLTI